MQVSIENPHLFLLQVYEAIPQVFRNDTIIDLAKQTEEDKEFFELFLTSKEENYRVALDYIDKNFVDSHVKRVRDLKNLQKTYKEFLFLGSEIIQKIINFVNSKFSDSIKVNVKFTQLRPILISMYEQLDLPKSLIDETLAVCYQSLNFNVSLRIYLIFMVMISNLELHDKLKIITLNVLSFKRFDGKNLFLALGKIEYTLNENILYFDSFKCPAADPFKKRKEIPPTQEIFDEFFFNSGQFIETVKEITPNVNYQRSFDEIKANSIFGQNDSFQDDGSKNSKEQPKVPQLLSEKKPSETDLMTKSSKLFENDDGLTSKDRRRERRKKKRKEKDGDLEENFVLKAEKIGRECYNKCNLQ